MTMSLLHIHDLSLRFITDSKADALHQVSFSLAKGKTTVLLGESGSGKSLTAQAIMQLLPDSCGFMEGGFIRWKGADLLACSQAKLCRIRGHEMGMVFQEPMTSLNPVYTIGQQLREAVKKTGHRYQIKQRLVELLTAVGIPEPEARLSSYPHELSGGMKQRVMIAMALAGDPDLLIADEPTTALDVTIQDQVLQLLQSIQKRLNMAILLITHDFGVARQMADNIVVMYAGEIIEINTLDQFFQHPLHPYSQKLFASIPGLTKRDKPLMIIPGRVPDLNDHNQACRFAPRCDQAQSLCWKTKPVLTQHQSHQSVRCHLYDQTCQDTMKRIIPSLPKTHSVQRKLEQTSITLLKADDIKIYYPVYKGLFKRKVASVKAVDGIDLTLHLGKTLAIVGESGCGKTTLAKGILQLLPIQSGTLEIRGRLLSKKPCKQLRQSVQMVFQDPFSSLNPRLLVSEILREGLSARQKKLTAKEIQTEINTLLEKVGLSKAAAHRYPHEFSGGQRQRIGIARSLAAHPAILVCDEPTSALDVSVQAQILNVLLSLQKTEQLSYVFITHNISVVAYMADYVAVMYLGRIVEEGEVEMILTNPKHPYTQALLAAVPQIEQTEKREKPIIQGEVPSPIHPPVGCHFHPRCPYAMEICKRTYPDQTKISNKHKVKCHLFSDNA